MFTQSTVPAQSWATRRLAGATLAALLCGLAVAGAALAQAPTAGQNINMVSGRTLPGGDPFLQRQNEPSLAVSSRNPRHLLAGANDYRTVDLPGLPDGTETGDAWLGLFKSFDGGETWQSTLIPGYPQDNSPEGLASPLKGYAAAADPIVRAGTHGLFYYGGIAFNRSTNLGLLEVTTFIDLNNKENGEVAAGRDPIRFAGTVVVDTGTSGQFLDKPWLGVDVPRAGALSRTFNFDGQSQTVPCGNLYLAWAKFTGNQSTKIMLARSRDCGLTWDNPTKLSESSLINQGTVVSVGPDGAVYVAWRHFATGSDPDAILFAKSTDYGRTFTHASVVAPAAGGTFLPFDQASDPAQSPYQTAFRTNSYPTLAASGPGRVHLAWAQRSAPGGFARIVMTTSTDGGSTWSAPAAVDAAPIVDDATPQAGSFDRGHQFMPQLTFSAGRLMLLYYDTRLDHTAGKYEPTPDYPDLLGRFYLETREPVGEWAPLGQPDPVFTARVDDAGLTERRHTIDVRVGQLDLCAANPAFTYARTSRSPFGVADFLGGQLQQLKFNPPNLPLFGLGRIPFVGDYIDIAGSDFAAGADGTWSFNTACGAAPVFHATWTSNEDVRPPSDGNWANYTPVGSPGCDPDRVGMRNQNIYSSRITEGLLVSSPQNAKRLKPFDGTAASVRAFVVLVQNLTDTQRRFRLHIANQPQEGKASFIKWDLSGDPIPDLEVEIGPRSGISRPVFATSTDELAAIRVEVQETSGGGLSGFLVLNADATTAVLADPDGGPAGVNTVEIYTPSVSNPSVYNPSVYNPSVYNPSVSNPSVYNPSVYNPSVYNPSVYNPSVYNPSVYNATEANPSVLNPSVYNSAFVNTPISDSTYEVTNTGNTTASYRVQLVGDPAAVPSGLQLLVSKNQLSPTSDGCQLVESAQGTVLVNIANPPIVAPSTILGPALDDASVGNATFSLRPGETGHVTLRGQFSLAEMQGIGSTLAPAVIAHPSDPANPEYAAPLAITNSALPGASFGVPFSASLTAFGGQTPYSFASTGSLPPGLALGSTGVLSGTPSGTGAYTFTASVTDQAGTTVSRNLSLTVAKTGTSLSVVLSPAAASVVGQPVTATAAIANDGSGTPTGSVTVGDGATSCEVTAPGGSCSLVFPTAGPRTITASYPGDDNYFDSSTTAGYSVSRATTATTLTSSSHPSAFGQAVTLTATVAVVAPGAGTATGTVSFTDGATPLGNATVGAGGMAALTTSSLGVGAHSIVATYSGDSNLDGGTSAPFGQSVNQAETATSLTSSANPSVYGQQVTWTASVAVVSPGAGAPTGTVSFMDGGSPLGAPVALAAGVAAFTTSSLAPGSHSITATYSGDGNHAGSSGAAAQQVDAASTTTTITGHGSDPSVVGQAVSVDVSVSVVSPGAGVATGTVTIQGDAATTCTVSNLTGTGMATGSCSLTFTSVGSKQLIATYAGTASLIGSTSASVGHTVNQAQTTTSLTSSANPSVYGQAVTFTATVSVVSPGAGTPAGTVSFTDGGTPIGAPVTPGAGGVATLSTSSLSAGSHSIAAAYSGDARLAGSTSAPVSQTVSKAATATTLGSSANPSRFGQSVTFTATVAGPSGAGTPTGSVSFTDGAVALGTTTLNAAGVATLSTGALAAGSHSVTATYLGDSSFASSASAPVSQVVNPAATSTTLTSTPNPSTFSQTVTFTATVAVTAPGSGAPSGSVTFKDGAIVLGSTPLSGGRAVLTTSTLGVGSHAITAQYGGDANFVGSTSAAVTQTVQATFAFTGFLTPLQVAGSLASPSYSGNQSFGSAIPVKWQLKDASGNFVGDLGTATWLRAYVNTSAQCKGAPAAGAAFTVLYSPTTGAKGNSTFRFGSNQYTFNWDTASTVVKGCYTVALQLSDGSVVKATNVQLR